MIIFKTINLINGKYYIGKDSKNSKSYLGSGLLIKNAIKKYGKNNFSKEILCFCKDLNDLSEKEAQYVNEDVINDPMSYNLALGGQGGDLSKFIKNWYLKGKTYEEVFGEERAIEIKKKHSISVSGEKNGMYRSDKTKGEKNGMYGRKGELCPAFGKERSLEYRENCRKAQLGKKASNETKQKMRISAKNREINYFIQQVDNNGNLLNEFKTISEAIETLKISRKKAYANSFKEFSFKKCKK